MATIGTGPKPGNGAQKEILPGYVVGIWTEPGGMGNGDVRVCLGHRVGAEWVIDLYITQPQTAGDWNALADGAGGWGAHVMQLVNSAINPDMQTLYNFDINAPMVLNTDRATSGNLIQLLDRTFFQYLDFYQPAGATYWQVKQKGT